MATPVAGAASSVEGTIGMMQQYAAEQRMLMLAQMDVQNQMAHNKVMQDTNSQKNQDVRSGSRPV